MLDRARNSIVSIVSNDRFSVDAVSIICELHVWKEDENMSVERFLEYLGMKKWENGYGIVIYAISHFCNRR